MNNDNSTKLNRASWFLSMTEMDVPERWEKAKAKAKERPPSKPRGICIMIAGVADLMAAPIIRSMGERLALLFYSQLSVATRGNEVDINSQY